MHLQRFLIVGLKEVDAGKTTVAQALLLYLRERGVKACGFKPKAGNILWYDYEVVYESLSHGRLYGKDSKLLRIASGTDLPEEIISPIHRLWATPPHHLKEKMAVLPYFIVDRITLWNDKPKEICVINDSLPFPYGAEGLVANLYKLETEVVHVRTRSELNKITNKLYDKAIALAHNVLKAEHDTLVYESYSDIALPFKSIKDLDLVLAVQPGYIQVYDPDKYLSALSLSKSLLREERTGNVVSLLKPAKTVRVPPYSPEEIIDGVKRKIRQLID
jgi:predicted P-loop ATPase/GTPase